jgi:hypothetical protein
MQESDHASLTILKLARGSPVEKATDFSQLHRMSTSRRMPTRPTGILKTAKILPNHRRHTMIQSETSRIMHRCIGKDERTLERKQNAMLVALWGLPPSLEKCRGMCTVVGKSYSCTSDGDTLLPPFTALRFGIISQGIRLVGGSHEKPTNNTI